MEIVARSERVRHKCILLSVLRTAATTPATRAGMTDRPIQREGRWRPTQRKCMTTVVADNVGNIKVEWYENSEEPGWYHFKERDGICVGEIPRRW